MRKIIIALLTILILIPVGTEAKIFDLNILGSVNKVSTSTQTKAKATSSEPNPQCLPAPTIPDNLATSREYFYLGKIKMPLQMIYDLQWWSEYRCYKPTLIVETYYSKGKITKTIKCTKLLNWWEPEKANCQTK